MSHARRNRQSKMAPTLAQKLPALRVYAADSALSQIVLYWFSFAAGLAFAGCLGKGDVLLARLHPILLVAAVRRHEEDLVACRGCGCDTLTDTL